MNVASSYKIGLILRAAQFAAEKHRNQRRKDDDASPYINHPIALANVLHHEGGVDDVVTLCAALLHDTVEDTGVRIEDIEREFGAEVAELVGWLTDVSTREDGNRATRKAIDREHISRASTAAKTIKLADIMSNSQRILAHDAPHVSALSAHSCASCEMVFTSQQALAAHIRWKHNGKASAKEER